MPIVRSRLTAAGGVVPGHLAKIGVVLDYLECQHRTPIISRPLRGTALALEAGYRSHTLSAEELARDVEGLAADDDNLLAAKELLGDNAGQAAKQVALAIDHNLYESPMVSYLQL